MTYSAFVVEALPTTGTTKNLIFDKFLGIFPLEYGVILAAILGCIVIVWQLIMLGMLLVGLELSRTANQHPQTVEEEEMNTVAIQTLQVVSMIVMLFIFIEGFIMFFLIYGLCSDNPIYFWPYLIAELINMISNVFGIAANVIRSGHSHGLISVLALLVQIYMWLIVFSYKQYLEALGKQSMLF